MTYLVPHNDGWLFYGMPATIAITSALLLTVVSFKQRALWYWMALIFVVVLAMSVWLKWQVEDSDKWRQHEVFMFYGWRLLLMAMLALPRFSTRFMSLVSRRVTRIFIGNCGLMR